MDTVMALKLPLCADALKAAFVTVNQNLSLELDRRAEPWARFAGSTAVLAVVDEQMVLVANVGDSRALLCKERTVIRLSREHKPTRTEEAARILGAGGLITKSLGIARVCGDLAMTRAFGALNMQMVGVMAEPELVRHMLSPDDQALVLGTDGLFETLNADKVRRLVLSGESSEQVCFQLDWADLE